MIQKRFQVWASQGGVPYIKWTEWFNTRIEGDENTVKQLNRSIDTKYQLKSSKLLNEFRYINN